MCKISSCNSVLTSCEYSFARVLSDLRRHQLQKHNVLKEGQYPMYLKCVMLTFFLRRIRTMVCFNDRCLVPNSDGKMACMLLGGRTPDPVEHLGFTVLKKLTGLQTSSKQMRYLSG